MFVSASACKRDWHFFLIIIIRISCIIIDIAVISSNFENHAYINRVSLDRQFIWLFSLLLLLLSFEEEIVS